MKVHVVTTQFNSGEITYTLPDMGEGVVISVQLTSEEISKALSGYWGGGSRIAEAVSAVLSNQSGPLVAELARHVKIRIDDPTFGTAISSAIMRGYNQAIGLVERRMVEATEHAINSGIGGTIGAVFSMIRRKLPSKSEI